MKMIEFPGSSRSGAQGWYWQRVTGVLLAVLLVGHFLLKHFGLEDAGAHQITYSTVARQLSSPWWVAFELGFLVVALWHGLNGVWMAAADYVHIPVLRIGVYTLLWVAGVFLLLVGLVTLLPFSRLGG
jgi:succinate dehydrogenase / fumarate reductase membrane anchor subunit